MEKFTTLTGIAAPLPLINVDTDMIIPKQFLKTIKRTGLGKHLFHEMRYDENDKYVADFILHQDPYHQAKILIAGENFGCGSSREHAPWALLDFGIRCIIAPSFADIFHNNCFKNGILPVTLPKETVERLMEFAKSGANATLTVDLANQTVSGAGDEAIAFDIDPFHKHCLINGLDHIGLTLKQEHKIGSFEDKQKSLAPWLWR